VGVCCGVGGGGGVSSVLVSNFVGGVWVFRRFLVYGQHILAVCEGG